MSLNVFKVLGGLGIGNDGHVLSGTSAPGGDTSLQDAAPTGSIYLRTDNSKFYIKISSDGDTGDWVEIPNVETVTSMINSSSPSISWREPADVVDSTNYADVDAAETAANADDEVDGVTISDGYRVLLTNLTSGNENVYIVSGSSGNWTFTEDSNTATNGDEVYIRYGTSAGDVYVYNGSEWEAGMGVSITNELGYIRSFVGKSSAGNVTPNYTSTNFVTNSTSLVAAITALDDGVFNAIGNRTYTSPTWVTSSQSVTASIQALDTNINNAIGNRTYTNPNFVSNSESLTASIQALDTAGNEYAYIRSFIGKTASGSSMPSYSSNNYVTASTSLVAAISALDDEIYSAIGDRTYTEENYITSSQSLTASLDALDQALASVASDVSELSNMIGVASVDDVTSATVIDSVNCRSYNAVRWIVTATNSSSPANKQAVEIYALHNGTSSTNATITDYNVSGILSVGTVPTGLTFNVTLTGSAGSQVMNLSVTSTTSVDVKALRQQI